jgi:hypothetical protein
MALYATDASVMDHWKFADRGTHHTFDGAGLHALLADGTAADDEISVRSVPLAFGIPGLLAVLRKAKESAVIASAR